jgi:hypothetical protein
MRMFGFKLGEIQSVCLHFVFNGSSESYFDFYNKMNQALISCYVKKRESKCIALKSRPRNYEILDFMLSVCR